MRGLNLLAKHSSRFLVHCVQTVRGNRPGVCSLAARMNLDSIILVGMLPEGDTS